MEVDDVIEFVLGEPDTATRWRLIDALEHPDFILRLRQATIGEALNDEGGRGTHGAYPAVAEKLGAKPQALRNIMSRQLKGPGSSMARRRNGST